MSGDTRGVVLPIPVTGHLSIDENDLQENFVRSSGAGGQNVNKVSTAVQLRFLATGTSKLPMAVRDRLLKIAGQRATKTGEIVIMAQRFRTQDRNRADAIERLVALVREAATRQTYRVPTKPTRASKIRRLDSKRKQGIAKQNRKSDVDQ